MISIQLGFDLSADYSADEIYHYALMDEKISGGQITLIVPESLGKCRLHKISLSELKTFIRLGLAK